ncbi:hypothetical protein QVD17_03319 [Tagetes erecta]|uniref:HTH myb-type domain-containing protein n=1 Tax=Tagetes erecta TaxID=13708 RepID=A0AAD8LE37_TARER|nr:hypothetical protein QVD17_03319 [Tagetes erecta]
MMTSGSELSLECKPHSYSILLKTIGNEQASNDGHDQTRKLEEFLLRLEEERLKIDAFKRELPLCMQLLTNAMETSRQQLQTCRANVNQSSPIIEEFIPLKNSNGVEPEKTSILSIDNKANWMSSAQLWSQAGGTTTANDSSNNVIKATQNSTTLITPIDQTNINFDTKQRNGGAFIPFSKERNPSCATPTIVLPELALSSGEKDVDHEENKSCVRENSSTKGGNGEVTDNQTIINPTATTGTVTSSQTHRKTRRCWSPDLHRRFVNALQMLGGSQVATPKQIRELMKVDGLTNDEVKSHLQKYRLHTRRPSPSPQSTGNATPQLVVLGGIWVPPEYATAAAGAQTLYTTHTNSNHLTPQEFYPNHILPPPPPPLHHHIHHHNGNLHHHNHIYKTSSNTTQSLQESNGRGGTTTTAGGNRSESIEDGKSESGGSWKAESGGGGGGETKVLMVREECEESNGSEVTLKF